ncbi:MAG TPA: hypothetical protein VFY71_06600 [Planctomycetota bacterium]|nr:hypothetical protein [Planctomycetota bacterium]
MRTPLLPFVVGLALLAGCASPEGETVAEKTAYTLMVRDEALKQLYERSPEAKDRIATAPGYVFLSGFAIHPGFLTFANAYGVVQDNASGKLVYVRMTRFGIGPGIAVKGYYMVATLSTPEVVAAVEQGKWQSGAFAEASFRFGDTGGSAAGETFSSANESWLWTHTGVALEVAAGFGKVYPEDDLN